MAAAAKQPEAPPAPAMDEALLGRLHRFSLELPGLEDEQRKTPESLESLVPATEHLRSHHLPLVAGVALVDAVALRCPGTDEGKALQLAEEVLARQAEHGFMHAAPGDWQFLTAQNAHFWEAGMAAILWVAHRHRLEGLAQAAGSWWRMYVELAGVWRWFLLPGVEASLAGEQVGRGRHLCADITNGAKLVDTEEPELTGPRLLADLPDVPMPRGGAIYRTPGDLVHLTYPAGGYRQVGGSVIYCSALPLDEPLFMVGTTKAKPAGALLFDADGAAWGVFGKRAGECPVTPPAGFEKERRWSGDRWVTS